MAATKRKPPKTTAAERLARAGDNVQDLSSFRQLEEPHDTPRMRSKRGIARGNPDFSQVCFKLERDRHTKLKVHCVAHGIEIGEFMDELLQRVGF